MPAEPITGTVHINATPERVFTYFTHADALVSWLGDYAVLDAVPGGEFTVDIRGVPVRGRYLEVEPPHRLLLSWGHAGSTRLPPGASLVEVRLAPSGDGTTVTITHRGLPEPEASAHREGWRYFLSRLSGLAGEAGPGGVRAGERRVEWRH